MKTKQLLAEHRAIAGYSKTVIPAVFILDEKDKAVGKTVNTYENKKIAELIQNHGETIHEVINLTEDTHHKEELDIDTAVRYLEQMEKSVNLLCAWNGSPLEQHMIVGDARTDSIEFIVTINLFTLGFSPVIRKGRLPDAQRSVQTPTDLKKLVTRKADAAENVVMLESVTQQTPLNVWGECDPYDVVQLVRDYPVKKIISHGFNGSWDLTQAEAEEEIHNAIEKSETGSEIIVKVNSEESLKEPNTLSQVITIKHKSDGELYVKIDTDTVVCVWEDIDTETEKINNSKSLFTRIKEIFY